jgi:hypothetical protein
MVLKYVPHQKLTLKSQTEFNEAWLQKRIADDPGILGLGEVRVIDRERPVISGGRLDLLLFDDDNNRRYEVEITLGATDPSHIIRTIEYWDIERRRYPGYEHVAVLIAEDITARFLNVMSLVSGSIPFIAIQLDALQVGDNIILNFVQVLDQTDLRTDDTDEAEGGEPKDRKFWEQRVGKALMQICDDVLAMANAAAHVPQELNYMRHYIGLRANGVVKNFLWFSPRPTKKFVHVGFHHPDAEKWKGRFEEAGVPIHKHDKRRLQISVNTEEFKEHQDVIREAIVDTVRQYDA